MEFKKQVYHGNSNGPWEFLEDRVNINDAGEIKGVAPQDFINVYRQMVHEWEALYKNEDGTFIQGYYS